MRRIGYPAVHAQARVMLGELQDSLKGAKKAQSSATAIECLRDAEFHRRNFDAWIDANVPWDNDLEADNYLSFGHGDPGRLGDAFSDAIQNYQGTRQLRIDRLLEDVRLLMKRLAVAARMAQSD